MKRTILVILIIALTFCLTACGCEHEWSEATCTDPKTCTLCQEVEGEPLGHKWKEATCTEAKTCETCKETEGSAMGHDYKEEKVVDYVTATTTVSNFCSRCNDGSETVSNLSTLHNDEAFLMSPVEFCDRFTNTAVTLVEEMRSDGVNFQAEYLCYIDEAGTRILVNMNIAKRLDGDDNKISIVGCLDPWREDNGLFFYNNKDVRGDIVCFRGPVQQEDVSFVMLALIKTLDPTADNTAAWELYEAWAQTGYVKSNGLVYAWIPGEEPDTITLSVYVG